MAVLRRGPRGGRYYIRHGRRVYVSKRRRNAVDERPHIHFRNMLSNAINAALNTTPTHAGAIELYNTLDRNWNHRAGNQSVLIRNWIRNSPYATAKWNNVILEYSDAVRNVDPSLAQQLMTLYIHTLD